MNVGVVGLGYWGEKVVEEYISLRQEDEINQVVACDADPGALAEIKDVDDKFESVEAALPSVDAIHVATSNDSHHPIASRALDAGKDVLVEKPLTVDRDLAFDLVEQASARGQVLQTGHVFRFANVVREVRELYQKETFGNVTDISLEWSHQHEPTGHTNVLWDLLPHPVDILNFITGEWPKDPSGVTTGRYDSNSPETASITANIPGTTVRIYVSWLDHVRRRRLAIAGSDQSAVVECVDQQLTIYDEDGVHERDIDANNTIRAEAENFIRAVDTRENTFNSAIVGARTVDSIQQVEESLNREEQT